MVTVCVGSMLAGTVRADSRPTLQSMLKGSGGTIKKSSPSMAQLTFQSASRKGVVKRKASGVDAELKRSDAGCTLPPPCRIGRRVTLPFSVLHTDGCSVTDSGTLRKEVDGM